MANTTTDKNVTMVRKEDKNFIRSMMSLSQDKKILIQGILIGLELQKNRPQRRPDKAASTSTYSQEADCNRRQMLEISEREN